MNIFVLTAVVKTLTDHSPISKEMSVRMTMLGVIVTVVKWRDPVLLGTLVMITQPDWKHAILYCRMLRTTILMTKTTSTTEGRTGITKIAAAIETRTLKDPVLGAVYVCYLSSLVFS